MPAPVVKRPTDAVRLLCANSCTQDLSVYDTIFASHFTFNGTTMTPEQMKAYSLNTTAAFPDRKITIERLFEEDDMACLMWSMTGTHLGTFTTKFAGAIPPSGSSFAIWGIDYYEVVDGKIVDFWSSVDRYDWMQKIGLLPEATASR